MTTLYDPVPLGDGRYEVVISVVGGMCGTWQAIDNEYEVTAFLTDPASQIRVRRIHEPNVEWVEYFTMRGRDVGSWRPAGNLLEVLAVPTDARDTIHVRRVLHIRENLID